MIEFDKTTHQCRRLTEKDGMLMNQIACLNLAGDILWIGYGSRFADGEGGLGRLDLSTRQFESFTPPIKSLETRRAFGEPFNEPTRHRVLAIAHGADNDIWFLSANGGRPCVTIGHKIRCGGQGRNLPPAWRLTSNGCSWGNPGPDDSMDKSAILGVSILDFKDGKWRTLKPIDGCPVRAVSAVACDGRDLWMGGTGYIALLDFEQEKVRKFARVQTEAVDQLQIGGGYSLGRVRLALASRIAQNVR